jgi:predicted nucleic acid-binding protein
MAQHLLDSSFCIACLRRKPWALRALANVPLASVAVSTLTVGELVLGAHLSDHMALEMAKVDTFLGPICAMPFGVEESHAWALLDAQLRKQGNRIETEDAIIAATAKVHGMTLVTGNTKHFARVKGLRVVDWERTPPKSVAQPR